jgi:hypothetical protein
MLEVMYGDDGSDGRVDAMGENALAVEKRRKGGSRGFILMRPLSLVWGERLLSRLLRHLFDR